ncbi:MAG: Sec-independent protein translocase protein TatB [Gammaproteobacteria bacterium]|nr:Sec-independent protein translocase protein TatB [Gammaproteobacteria bacterium]
MFDVGFSELALLAILALVIAGPERLPGIMRGLGRLAARARSMTAAIRTELEREVDSAERGERSDEAASKREQPGDD